MERLVRFPKARRGLRFGEVVAAVVILGAAPACRDDTAAVPGGGTETDSTGPDTPTGSATTASTSGDTEVTASDDTSGSASSGEVETGTGTSTGTGGTVAPGQTRNELVSVGQRMSSANHTVVFTLGQPTQHQGTHNSTNYRLQGGLVGANGSPP